MGLARHNPSGHWRLGLSATAASAVLYSAIVLFGVGSASPSALDAGSDPHASAVLVLPQADSVSGSVQRLPQASPEPRRQRSRARVDRPRAVVVPTPTPSATESPTPASPRQAESKPRNVTGPTTASVAEPLLGVSVPVVSLAAVTVTLPELPVQLPEAPAPPSLPLALPPLP
jgi:hypothetical protein